MEKKADRQRSKHHIFKGLKFTSAALLSIVLAKELGLICPYCGYYYDFKYTEYKKKYIKHRRKAQYSICGGCSFGMALFSGIGVYCIFLWCIFVFVFYAVLCLWMGRGSCHGFCTCHTFSYRGKYELENLDK